MTLAQENSILALIGTEPDGLKPIEIRKLAVRGNATPLLAA